MGWIWRLKDKLCPSIFQNISLGPLSHSSMVKATVVHYYCVARHEDWQTSCVFSFQDTFKETHQLVAIGWAYQYVIIIDSTNTLQKVYHIVCVRCIVLDFYRTLPNKTVTILTISGSFYHWWFIEEMKFAWINSWGKFEILVALLDINISLALPGCDTKFFVWHAELVFNSLVYSR